MVRKTRGTAQEQNQIGVTFFQAGAIDLALEQFKSATKRAPWVASYWLNLGVALLEKKKLDDAQIALERSISLQPKSQGAYYHMAQLYRERGDEETMRVWYQKSIELDPYTYLAQRAREIIEGRRPRIIVEDPR